MRRTQRFAGRKIRRTLTALAIVAASGLLAGCDQTGEVEYQLREAASLLAQVGPTPTGEYISQDDLGRRPSGLNDEDGADFATASEAFAADLRRDEAKLAKAKSILAEVAKRGLPSQKAAANLLLSEVHFAEASRKHAIAAREGRAFAAAVWAVGQDLELWGEWQHQVRLARVLEGTDGNDSLAKTQAAWRGSIREAQEMITAIDAELADAEASLTSLRGRVAEITSRAEAARAGAAHLRLVADSADEHRSLELLRQWQVHSRDADVLELEAERVEDDIREILPRIHDLESRKQAMVSNIAALERALADLDQGRQEARQRREGFERRSEELAKRIDLALFEPEMGLVARRDALYGESGVFDDAIRTYQAGSAAAGLARSALKVHADVATARAMQSMGSVHWQAADDLAALIALLQRVATLPEFSGRGGEALAKAIEDTARMAETERENAGSRFENASTSLGMLTLRSERGRVIASHTERMLMAAVDGTAGREVLYAEILADSLAAMASGREYIPPAFEGGDDEFDELDAPMSDDPEDW
ncbi:MAG: hypothetical protein KF866_12940 [Phycisphaeraceae bacterium]|nr:hypothetical protein [Phycisphaeraceae bacterium]